MRTDPILYDECSEDEALPESERRKIEAFSALCADRSFAMDWAVLDSSNKSLSEAAFKRVRKKLNKHGLSFKDVANLMLAAGTRKGARIPAILIEIPNREIAQISGQIEIVSEFLAQSAVDDQIYEAMQIKLFTKDFALQPIVVTNPSHIALCRLYATGLPIEVVCHVEWNPMHTHIGPVPGCHLAHLIEFMP